jgi:hypothetical protein
MILAPAIVVVCIWLPHYKQCNVVDVETAFHQQQELELLWTSGAN